MWDDEDNNPYGSFHRRDSETSEVVSPNERMYLELRRLVVEVAADPSQASTERPHHHPAIPHQSSHRTFCPDPTTSAMKSLMMIVVEI
jgi:hypothetical protein